MGTDIRNRISSIQSLPTLPSTVGKVMSIIEDPKSSVSDLVKHMDPSLVTEVLKVANSAYFGRKNFRHIGTIEQAIAAIGYAGLSYVVLQLPFLSMMTGREQAFDRRGFVRHSLSVGVMGRTVSSAFSLGSPSSTYISGILHDIGIIVIYQYFAEEWQEIKTLMERDHLPRVEAERAVLSIDHAEVGSILLSSWDIPEAIAESVRLHHSGPPVGEREDRYVTWLANNLAKQIECGRGLLDFNTFFGKQRELLLLEMPDTYLLNHHVEFFGTAYEQLNEIEGFLENTSGERND